MIEGCLVHPLHPGTLSVLITFKPPPAARHLTQQQAGIIQQAATIEEQQAVVMRQQDVVTKLAQKMTTTSKINGWLKAQVSALLSKVNSMEVRGSQCGVLD